MALRHPWFSQTLKRKCPDDLLPSEGSSGFGPVGTVYGSLTTTNACNIPQASQPSQALNLNGRATKRVRKFESRNLERGFAELSIQPTSPASSPPVHIQQQYREQRPDTQVGGDGVWSNVVGNVGESSNVVYPDGSTLPLLRSSSVHEPPSPEVTDVQMSTPTWYEPEKDSEFLPQSRAITNSRHGGGSIIRNLMMFGITGIVITSLDDDEYDGDDEGQQQRRTGAKPTGLDSDFTISPAFLNAINKKLAQAIDPPTPPPTDTPASQALVLFRPLPPIAPPPASEDLKDPPSHREWVPDCFIQGPPSPPPSMPSPFYARDPAQSLFVSNDDDMEIEML